MSIDNIDPSAQAYYNAEKERQEAAKRQAAAAGLELLTPGAAAALFHLTLEAIRQARRRGQIESRLILDIGGKKNHLLLLRDALALWGNADVSELDAMRANGFTLFADGLLWLVLHSRPAVHVHYSKDKRSVHMFHTNIDVGSDDE